MDAWMAGCMDHSLMVGFVLMRSSLLFNWKLPFLPNWIQLKFREFHSRYVMAAIRLANLIFSMSDLIILIIQGLLRYFNHVNGFVLRFGPTIDKCWLSLTTSFKWMNALLVIHLFFSPSSSSSSWAWAISCVAWMKSLKPTLRLFNVNEHSNKKPIGIIFHFHGSFNVLCSPWTPPWNI